MHVTVAMSQCIAMKCFQAFLKSTPAGILSVCKVNGFGSQFMTVLVANSTRVDNFHYCKRTETV